MVSKLGSCKEEKNTEKQMINRQKVVPQILFCYNKNNYPYYRKKNKKKIQNAEDANLVSSMVLAQPFFSQSQDNLLLFLSSSTLHLNSQDQSKIVGIKE